MRPRIIPDVVPRRDVLSVPPDSSVRAAARLMADHHVAALLVMESGQVRGILTERDITARVVAAGRCLDQTTAAEVMTPEPLGLHPDDSVAEALDMLSRHGFRHLPVIEAGVPVAMVSVRDLYAAVHRQLETDILHRDAWILGVSDVWDGDDSMDGG